LINGTPNAEILYGTEFDDVIEAHDGNDTVYGDDGDDYIAGQEGADMLMGGAGDDLIVGNHHDLINGGDGDDKLYLDVQDPMDIGMGFYLMDGQSIEALYGSLGDDRLEIGTSYGARVEAGSGNDYINGGTGNDTLSGGAGNDTVFGGDDRLVDDEGSNVMWGGAGNDTFGFNRWHQTNSIMDFEGAGAAGGDVINVFRPSMEQLDFEYFMQNHVVQVGNDTHLVWESTVTILVGVAKDSLIASDFTFS